MLFFINNVFSWEFENNFVSDIFNFSSFSVQVNHFTEISGKLGFVIFVVNLSRYEIFILEIDMSERFFCLDFIKSNRRLVFS